MEVTWQKKFDKKKEAFKMGDFKTAMSEQSQPKAEKVASKNKYFGSFGNLSEDSFRLQNLNDLFDSGFAACESTGQQILLALGNRAGGSLFPVE